MLELSSLLLETLNKKEYLFIDGFMALSHCVLELKDDSALNLSSRMFVLNLSNSAPVWSFPCRLDIFINK